MKNFLLILFFLIPSLSFPAPVTIDLHPVTLPDLVRIVHGDMLNQSFTLGADFLQDKTEVSINWKNISPKLVASMTHDMITSRGYEMIEDGRVLTIRRPVAADNGLLIYPVKYRSAKYLADLINKVAGFSQMGSRGLPAPSGSVSNVSEVAGSASQVFDRSALDQLVYSCSVDDCARLRSMLVQLDTVEPNVILRAVIYEVSSAHNEGSAIDLAASVVRGGKSLGVSLGSTLSGGASASFSVGGLDAVISSLDSDSRFKSLSRPLLRVKTGGTAKFSVGQSVPVLGSVAFDNNGNAVQSVEYHPSGTIFTVTPDIRGDVIDLVIFQELSSFAVTTSGVNNSPTLLQRTASSTLSLHQKEVIVFAGLEEVKEAEADENLFGFIPVSSKKNNSKTEVLLFVEAEKI